MKKLALTLTVLAVCGAVYAGPEMEITAQCDGNVLRIGYDASAVPAAQRPVGIALLVMATDGGEITGPGTWNTDDFPVYMDYAYTEETGGDGFDDDPWEGHPYAAAEDSPGALLLEDFPVSSLVICMGRLTEPPTAGPPVVEIAALRVNGKGSYEVVEELAYRGGVVSFQPGVDLDVIVPEPVNCECDHCWCLPTQKLGDTNGDHAVNFIDLAAVKKAFFSCEGDPNYDPCADFNHDGCVNFMDLAILKTNFFKILP